MTFFLLAHGVDIWFYSPVVVTTPCETEINSETKMTGIFSCVKANAGGRRSEASTPDQSTIIKCCNFVLRLIHSRDRSQGVVCDFVVVQISSATTHTLSVGPHHTRTDALSKPLLTKKSLLIATVVAAVTAQW